MTDSTGQLAKDRANRSAAKRLFDRDLATVQADLSARGIVARIKAKAADEVREIADDAFELATESKGIIAGTIAVLLAWTFRNPLLRFTKRLFSRGEPDTVHRPADSDNEAHQE